MKSPLADAERDRLIAAMLPDVPFDGWSQHALRLAAERIGMPVADARALFPRGAIDMVAAVSRWADRQMLDRVEAAPPEPLSLSRRVARALRVLVRPPRFTRALRRRGSPAGPTRLNTGGASVWCPPPGIRPAAWRRRLPGLGSPAARPVRHRALPRLCASPDRTLLYPARCAD